VYAILFLGVKIMEIDEQIAISVSREYLVVKGNDLIQRSRFELSLAEQKTIAYICSLIKPVEPSPKTYGVPFQLEYEFSIRDYCKVCGIYYDSGKNYTDIKALLKKLSDRSMWLERGDEEILVRWLAKVKTNKRSGTVQIKLDEDLVPYLFDLYERFTQYHLYNILAMKSAYSVRMYELMKSYAFQKRKVFDLDKLKQILMVDGVASYNIFPSFRQKVLDTAMEEINGLTDLKVEYRMIKKGNKVVKVEFIINQKGSLERWMAGEAVNKNLEAK
jgi:plasmid replication initiation protein